MYTTCRVLCDSHLDGQTWKLLGNVGRPAALAQLERNVWRLLLRVLDGSDITACLLSFLGYWNNIAISYSTDHTDAATWFKPGPLPTGQWHMILRTSRGLREPSRIDNSWRRKCRGGHGCSWVFLSNTWCFPCQRPRWRTGSVYTAIPLRARISHNWTGTKRTADSNTDAAESSKRPVSGIYKSLQITFHLTTDRIPATFSKCQPSGIRRLRRVSNAF